MSHAFETQTFSVASNELPASFASVEELVTFKRAARARADARSDGFHFLWGSTRSGWAIYTMRALLRSVPDVNVLQFLWDDGRANSERSPVPELRTYTLDTEDGLTQATVLDPAAVELAYTQLDRLLARMKAEPARVYDADEEGVFMGDDVEPALARDYVSAKPAFDPQVRDDDGQGADYLCTYLRSMLALLRTAHAQRLAVAHILEI